MKFLSKIKDMMNNVTYRHTNAKRLHYQKIHNVRNVKGVLQEKGDLHQIEFRIYIEESKTKYGICMDNI